MGKPISLVTGACGFMGSMMVSILSEAGHQVRATDLASTYEKDDRKLGRFPSVLKDRNIEFIPSDMTKPETLRPLVQGVDYVFHIASVFNYTVPYEVLRQVNVLGTKHLCDLLLNEPTLKKFVMWGAGGVYGLPEQYQLPLTEEEPPMPCNNYLKSKWQQEYLVMNLGKTNNFPYAIMRPTTVYGPRCVYGAGMLFLQLANMKVVACPSNFTFRIPFVHVEDVCRAALFLAENPDVKQEIFNLNDDSHMGNDEFMKFMARENGHIFIKIPPLPIKRIQKLLIPMARRVQALFRRFHLGTPPLEAETLEYLGRDFVYSNEKLKKAGYIFKYPDARDGIRDTLAWYRQNGWL
jgi:UDP-glucose 4-epimerase